MLPIPFAGRVEAGRLLGAELISRRLGANPIVLALPRGGVVVGAAVAEALNAPLDVVVVRKLGAPWQPELAIGAIAGGTRVLDRELIRELGISAAEINRVVARETLEMTRREAAYRDGRPAPELRDKTAILIDDGVATGATMAAAARHVRGFQPRKVVVAAPVASFQAAERIAAEADECVWLAVPNLFLRWANGTKTSARSRTLKYGRCCGAPPASASSEPPAYCGSQRHIGRVRWRENGGRVTIEFRHRSYCSGCFRQQRRDFDRGHRHGKHTHLPGTHSACRNEACRAGLPLLTPSASPRRCGAQAARLNITSGAAAGRRGPGGYSTSATGPAKPSPAISDSPFGTRTSTYSFSAASAKRRPRALSKT